jgi:drug/metabolite transporter (DMT)-like permease
MKKEWGIWLILSTAVISGFSIFVNKFGVAGINSSIFAFGKNIVVSIFLLSIILALGSCKRLAGLAKRQWLGLAAVGLIGGSIPFLLFFRGLQLTSGAAGSFLQKSMFVFVAIAALVFLREKLHRTAFIASIMLLAGNFLFLRLNAFSWNFGNTLILIATLFWAAENTLSKYLLGRDKMDGNVLAFGRMFFGSLFIMAYLILTGEFSQVFLVTAGQLSWIIATSVLLLGYVTTWYNGLKHVKVTVATSILLLGSPITSLMDYFYSGAAISTTQIIGAILLVLGIATMFFFSEAAANVKHSQLAISTAKP